MLSKEQNLKQMNAMYEANPRILEDVHRAVQGGKEESVFFCLATFKKHVIWSRVVLQRMVIPFDNRNLKKNEKNSLWLQCHPQSSKPLFVSLVGILPEK